MVQAANEVAVVEKEVAEEEVIEEITHEEEDFFNLFFIFVIL